MSASWGSDAASLAARTWAAAQRVAEGADRVAALGNAPPRAGDLWTVGDDEGVEWAVLEARGGSLSVVPADSFPLVGSADLAIPETSGCGPLTLRCGLVAEIPAASLATGRRSGLLEAAIVERALCGARDAGSRPDDAAADTGEGAVDRDPAYRQHCEAHTERLARLRREAQRSGGRPGRLPWIAAAVAASLLVVVSGVAVWQARRAAELAAASASGAAASPAEPRVNAPFLWLQPDETVRGEAIGVPAPGEGDRLLLILQLNDLRSFERYRIELSAEGEDAPLWVSDASRLTGTSELSLSLPGGLLRPARYRVRVAGIAGQERVPLHTYTFRPTPAQRQSP